MPCLHRSLQFNVSNDLVLDIFSKEMDFWQVAPFQARTSIKIDPNDTEAWGCKGRALESLGLTAEADAALAKARELGFEG